MKTYMDVNALNTKFWATDLTYTDYQDNELSVPSSQIVTENGPPRDVDESKPWVRWIVSPGGSKRTTSGNVTLYKNLGTAFLEVHLPIGYGTGQAEEIRDAFIHAFADWQDPAKKLRVYKHDSTKGAGTESSYQLDAIIYYQSYREQ
ncbi:hypothetical protein PF049_00190 [Erythrobacteraceae bacterium WH01K]|nr:hypothetical protein PF049_00190 [Erythrobacteraceae bacterium WH01K]